MNMWNNFRGYKPKDKEGLLFTIVMKDGNTINTSGYAENGRVKLHREGLEFSVNEEYPEGVKDVYYIIEKDILR